MQHVNLREAIQNGTAAQHAEIFCLMPSQDVITTVTKRDRFARRFSQWRRKRFGSEEPSGRFVPGALLIYPLAARCNTESLQHRTKIREVASVEYGRQSAVVGSVIW